MPFFYIVPYLYRVRPIKNWYHLYTVNFFLKEVRRNNLFIEEILILMDKIRYVIEKNQKEKKVAQYKKGIYELRKVIYLPEDKFKKRYNSVYSTHLGLEEKKWDGYCLELCNALRDNANFFAGRMSHYYAMICGKALQMLTMALGNDFNYLQVRAWLNMARFESCVMNLRQEQYCYEMAIKVSQEVRNTTFEYIVIVTRFIRMMVFAHLMPQFDLDERRRYSEKKILDFAEREQIHVENIAEYLLSHERILPTYTELEKDRSVYVKGQLVEMKYFVPALFALARGDQKAAEYHLNILEQAQTKAYGEAVAYQQKVQIQSLYGMLFDSPERREHAPDDMEQIADPEYVPLLPNELSLWDKFQMIMMEVNNRLIQKHFISAEANAGYLLELAVETRQDIFMAYATYFDAKVSEAEGKKDQAIRLLELTLKIIDEFSDDTEKDVFLYPYLRHQAYFGLSNISLSNNPNKSIEYATKGLATLIKGDACYVMWYANLLLIRGRAYKYNNEKTKAENDFVEALDAVIAEAKRRIPFMDADLRENYWDKCLNLVYSLFAEADENSSQRYISALYNAVLMSKGLLLSSERSLEDAVKENDKNRDLQVLYSEIRAHEESRLVWGKSQEDNDETNYANAYLKNIQLFASLNKIITKHFAFMNYQLEDVRKSLCKEQVLVDIFDFPDYDGEIQYVAFLQTKDQESPTFIKLCKESNLNEVFKEVSAQIYENGERFFLAEAYNPQYPYSSKLYSLIWIPIIKAVNFESACNILFIPSGTLCKMPIESLAVSVEDDIVFSDFYNSFRRFSHAREINNHQHSVLGDSIELFGGLDYGDEMKETAEERRYRINISDSESTELRPWLKLEGTRKEVTRIAFQWSVAKNQNVKAKMYFEGGCNEFIKLSGHAPSVIHIATHGFFETPESAKKIPALLGKCNPMDLSGIVLANGNNGWLHGTPSNHEGILTATEIAKLDLSNTSLVVLSSCNSGNGIIRSDGIYGLQRAFKETGVKSIIMSLWNESDEVGTMFMTYFYSYLLTRGLDMPQAFLRAKTEVRKKYPHPIFWANFIMLD